MTNETIRRGALLFVGVLLGCPTPPPTPPEGGTSSLDTTTLDVGSTTDPREPCSPLEPALSFGAVPLEDGCFTLDLCEVVLPGEANPITGSEVVATITLAGCFHPTGYCGQVTGMATSPLALDLEGSTFAAVPADPMDLPIDFPFSC